MMTNTQSKAEWIKSDVMTFKLDVTEHDGMRIQVDISLEKADTATMIQTIKMNRDSVSGSMTTTQQCFKQ